MCVCSDTLGTLARTVGDNTFRPLALDCVTAGKVRYWKITKGEGIGKFTLKKGCMYS